jgi:hypothetical protein
MTQEEILRILQDVFEAIFDDDVVLTTQRSARDIPDWDSLDHKGRIDCAVVE